MPEQQLQATGNEWVDERLAEIEAGIQDPNEKIEALLNLAAEMLPSRAEVLQQAREAANAVEDEDKKAELLSEISAQSPLADEGGPAELLQQALDKALAGQIDSDEVEEFAKKVGQLSSQLPEEAATKLLQAAFKRALAMDISTDTDEEAGEQQAIGLYIIAHGIPQSATEFLTEITNTADNLQNDSAKAKVLSEIALRLPKSEQNAVLERALAAADNIEDNYAKAEALSDIASRLPESEQNAVLERALAAADNIEDNYAKAYALRALASRLPESEQNAVLERALDAADNIEDDSNKADVLSALASRLPESNTALLERALDAADNVKDDSDKADVLSALAPCLPESNTALLERALAVADNIQDDYDKASALSAIAPRLPKSEQKAVLERAFAVIDNFQYEGHKAFTLREIAPRLPESEQKAVLERALAAADNLEKDSDKAFTLSEIAPHLPESEPALLERALAAADNIQDDYDKASALSAIAPRLPASEQKAVLKRALDAADNLQDDYQKVQALSAIAPRLPASEQKAVLKQALDAADNLQYDYQKVQALSAIAPRLPASEPALLKQALAAADNIQDDSLLKAFALSAIAPRLPESEQKAVLERALDVADNIQDDGYKAKALSAIAPRLPEPEQKAVLERALDVADNIQYYSDKASALSAIAPRLPESNTALLKQVLAAADKIQDDFDKANALIAIAPRLPESEPALLERALAAADSLQNDRDKARALSEIAPRLPEPEQKAVLERALAAADNIQDDSDKIGVLTDIAPQLPDAEILVQQFSGDQFSLVLNLVKAQATNDKKVQLLSVAAPQLSLGLLPAALQIIAQGAIKTEALRVEALGNLAPYLPVEQFSIALELCRRPSDNPDSAATGRRFIHQDHRATALTHLLPYLATLDQYETACALTKTAISKLTYRAEVLTALATALASERVADMVTKLRKIAKDDQPTTAQERFAALVNDVWDMLLTLPGEAYMGQRATILCRLVPAMAISQIDNQVLPDLQPLFQYQAENSEHGLLTDSGYLAQVLTAITTRRLADNPAVGTDAFQNPIVESTKTLIPDDLYGQVKVLSPLRSHRAIKRAKEIQSPSKQAAVWVEIACYLPEHQYKALQLINHLPDAYLQSQYLQRLIPHLAPTQSLEAARVAKEINRNYQRVQAFVALACKFPQFRADAEAAAMALADTVQRVEQLSLLAVEKPEVLPKIIDILEQAKFQPGNQKQETSEPENTPDENPEPEPSTELSVNTPANSEAKAENEASEVSPDSATPDSATQPQWYTSIQRQRLLKVLTAHLPRRINQEVNRSVGCSPDLWDRALFLLARGYRDALQGGSLRNESALADDLLNLKDEVNALADLLLMRDLQPPMAVGILGGWGGGKSYIMHLMQQHMTAVRSRKVDLQAEAWHPDPNHEKLSPYVGHIYQIKFDAWTFAKSNLWASLMQTVFFELNRQISLEQELRAFFEENGIDPYSANSKYADIWQVLYKASEEDRKYFLQNVLSIESLEDLRQQVTVKDRLNTAENLLWGKFGATKEQTLQSLQEKRTELEKTKTHFKDTQAELTEQKRQLEVDLKQVEQEAAQKFQRVPKSKLKEVIQTSLGVSGLVLKTRLGPTAFEELQTKIIQQLPEDVDVENLQTFGIELREAVTKVLEGSDQQGAFPFSWKALRKWVKTNLTFLVIFSLFAGSAVALPLLVAKFNPTALVPQIVAFITPLLPALAMAQKLWRSAHKWHDQARQALQDYEEQIQRDSQQRIQTEKQQWLAQKAAQNHQSRITELERTLQDLEKQQQDLQHTIQDIEKELPDNLPKSLADYVSSRIQDGSYDQHLGLMHQVKEDLINLSRRLLPPPMSSTTNEEFEQRMQDLQQVFPRGPARVVVYIDDLDRCPPNRVVEVLEAVQLLVKTPLFIAVLAIDERYITRALEQYYKGVLHRKGSPSGTDYLEKIIQLPYRVRPIMPSALETYLRAQVVIQDNASGGSKFSEFTRQEFDMLKECCRQTGLSPRTLKRLTNVYKLFKVVCRTRGTKPSLQTQQAILALLALSGRYPNLMRGIFDSIESCYEENRQRLTSDLPEAATSATPHRNNGKAQPGSLLLYLDSPLRDAFKEYALPDCDQYLQREFAKLYHDALETTILPPETFTLQDLGHEIFNLIRSFSFVGEIGEDPEDYRNSGLVSAESKNGHFSNQSSD